MFAPVDGVVNQIGLIFGSDKSEGRCPRVAAEFNVEAVENSQFDFCSLPAKHIFSPEITQDGEYRRNANSFVAQVVSQI